LTWAGSLSLKHISLQVITRSEKQFIKMTKYFAQHKP
jgi:hypothetical protein